MDEALSGQLGVLFQAMGIVQLASEAILRDLVTLSTPGRSMANTSYSAASQTGCNQQHGRAGVLAV